ncbi:MAG: FkbM family methyltransferase [Desulfovibrionaceae bacterium]|nr:FkbM family methyltransferase [Desulfovibrionaceae bacterium]
MMDRIKTLFALHDEACAASGNSARSRFGSLWRPGDGIILYPPRDGAADYITLLKATVPDIPLLVCDDTGSAARSVSGLRVHGLDEAVARLPRALWVLFASGDKASALFARIAPRLSAAHLNNMITFRQLGEFLPVGDKKSRYFDGYRKTFLAAAPRTRAKVENAFELFRDPLSQAVFCAVLKRYLLCSDTLIPVSSSPEYFEDVYTRLPDEVFVDCGAYTGDTLHDFLRLGGSLKEYHGFEPDPGNFAELSAHAAKLPAQLQARIHLYRNAVGHERATVFFDAAGTMGSAVNPDGTSAVESVALDETLNGVSPTLIKLDIEGYEAFALQGARGLIRGARPVLALCVYHHPFDLWELPLLVTNMVDGYRFFLRAYQEQFSYICYCVPSERLGPACAG